MLNIRSIFTGKWASKYRDFEIRFNGRIWLVIAEYDEPDEMMVGLFDRTDGSSIIINTEILEFDEFDHEIIQSHFFKELFNKDSQLKVEDDGVVNLFNKKFYYVQYKFHNKKFGEQDLFDFYRWSNDEIYLIRCGAPSGVPPEDGSLLSGKLNILLNSIDAESFA